MKKSVLILVICLYILSIGVVGFIGIKMSSFEGKTYIKSIDCYAYSIGSEDKLKFKVNSSQEKYCTIKESSIPHSDENPIAVQLYWKIYPTNPTSKKVIFIYDEERDVATVNSVGTVIFNKKGSIRVTIMSDDGNATVKDSVKINLI